MVSAAEMLQFLQRRAQLQAHRLPPPGEFPAGWQRWFSSMRERVGAVTGATADAIVELLSARPLEHPPPPMAELTRWKAFNALWRQDWHPASTDDARTRLIAAVFTGVWHLLFAAMLLWLMYLQYLVPPAPPAGEDVVQVEYVGIGTPKDVGGGAARQEPAAPAAATPSPAADEPESGAPAFTPAATPSVAVELPTPDLAAPAPDVPQLDIPEPQAPAVVAEQPVAVSEPSRTEDPVVFELPPPRPRVADRPSPSPVLRMPTREVQVVDVPAPVQPIQPREVTQRPVEARTLEARTPTVAEREIPAPLPRVALPDVPTPVAVQPRLRTETPRVEAREIPAPAVRSVHAPAANPAPGSAVAPAAATTAPATAASTSTAGNPAASEARAAASAPPGAGPSVSATPAPGAGPRAASAPGALPSARRGDDWGDSTRDRPGAQRGERPGLYNSDGSVRLGEPPGSASPGQPPGTVTQEIANLDRAGTWLKRKPTDYEPTAFDRFWRPNETLLEEWVRKGIKQVAIPIPGSSKRIVCVVSLLQFGGGCGLEDPNINEQPASARPPPDIPFKPHLQEGNGGVPAGS